MEPRIQQEKLMLFCDSLPFAVVDALGAKDLDILLTLSGIYTAHEFVLYETGNICEGVLKVLKGEDSPSNLVAFIEKDEHIEEDNRPKIPEIAYEIQTKIFDPVLPILKQAGFPIKEGRVAKPLMKYEVGSSKVEGQGVVSPYAPVPALKYEVGSRKYGEAPNRIQDTVNNAPPLPGQNSTLKNDLDERNVRALIRIATGTTYSEDDLKDAFLSLPQGLRQSLSSVDTANAIQDIAKRYFLHVDQMAQLASETGLVLLGLTHPADFIKNLARRLRMPEEKAREIARDISSQILVKVREGLRNLHEEKPASSFQVQGSSQKKIEMAKNPSISNLPSSSAGLKAKSYQLEASSTPYSAGTKWNTGENILSKQVQQESPIDRAEVLRGIENPYTIPQVRTAPLPSKTLIGPTGWKPATADGGKSQFPISNFQEDSTAPIPQPSPRSFAPAPTVTVTPPKVSVPTPPRNEFPHQTLQSQSSVGQGSMQSSRRLKYEVGRNATERSVPTTPAQKARPQSEVPSYTSVPTPPPQDFLDQKLQTPVALSREEKRYTTDPYREPLQ